LAWPPSKTRRVRPCHQTQRYAARSAGRRSSARGSLPGRPTDAEERRGAESREEADLCGPCKRDQREKERSDWRCDEESGVSYALKLPAAGAKAIGIDEEIEPQNARSEEGALENCDQAAVSSKVPARDVPQPMESVPAGPSAPRGGSKLAQVIELLQRDHGATIYELIAATGWLAHTTRAALTGLRKRGYVVAIDRSDNERGSFYRIIAEGDGEPVGRPNEEPADFPTSRKPAQRISKPRARRAA
jgi:hypothetical protein